MDPSLECYVDTSALIALLDRSDRYHPRYARLFADPPRLVSSSLVIAEGHAWFLRRYDERKAIQFLQFIQALAPLMVLPFGIEELSKTSALLKKLNDQRLTLADLHGLVIMRERRVKACWSTDRHLGLTGVPLEM